MTPGSIQEDGIYNMQFIKKNSIKANMSPYPIKWSSHISNFSNIHSKRTVLIVLLKTNMETARCQCSGIHQGHNKRSSWVV